MTTVHRPAPARPSGGYLERFALPDVAPLSQILSDATAISHIDAGACAALASKLVGHTFNLVVVGEFKRGKSTVINALLGLELLPTGVVPLTSVVTIVEYGATAGATVTYESGDAIAAPLSDLADYVTERGNPKNAKRVREVTVTFPADWLKGGIRLVDTPGIGSVHAHNTEVTYRYLPQADAVIFVASADQPTSRAELDFLVEVRRFASKVFCLLNKIDYLAPTDQAECVNFVTSAVSDALGTPLRIYPVSARRALQVRAGDDSDVLVASGLAAFDEALRGFLMEEGGTTWFASLRQHLLRILSEGRLSAELELRALSSPLAVLETNLRALSERKRDLFQSASDVTAVLDVEARKLVREWIEPELATFKDQLTARLLSCLSAWYPELRRNGSVALRAALEERTLRELRGACEVWQAEADVKVSGIFAASAGRLARRIQDGIDEVLRYSAELFAIPFTPVRAESLWQSHSNFYFRSWDEPPGLKLLTVSIVLMLPGPLGHPLILRAARRRAADLVDMHAGRLRHDFEERIKASAQGFARELVKRIEGTLAGTETAIENGRELQRLGEGRAAPRRANLAAVIERIQALDDRARLLA